MREFNDIKLITDSRGNPRYWKPIAQFDLKDSISGRIRSASMMPDSGAGSNTGSSTPSSIPRSRMAFAIIMLGSYDMGDPEQG